MKCPKAFVTTDDNEGNRYINGADCIQEECAWWDNASERCCIHSINCDLDKIAILLLRIADKMPHEEQFRK